MFLIVRAIDLSRRIARSSVIVSGGYRSTDELINTNLRSLRDLLQEHDRLLTERSPGKLSERFRHLRHGRHFIVAPVHGADRAARVHPFCHDTVGVVIDATFARARMGDIVRIQVQHFPSGDFDSPGWGR